MESLVSFLIPIAPHHQGVVGRAIASVESQTVPCSYFTLVDRDGLGPGWARNRLVEMCDTSLIVFLDADDWVENNFVEECLKVIRPGEYVYTGWKEGRDNIDAPIEPWFHNNSHVITTLMFKKDFEKVGGFDESMPAMEDADFYLKLNKHGIWGRRLNKPLFVYTNEGKRSRTAKEMKLIDDLKEVLQERYKDVACCGGNAVDDSSSPIGEKMEGDVLATALWSGNRRVRGKSTGRLYPRASNPKKLWVNPKDLALAPKDFALSDIDVDAYVGVQALTQQFVQMGLLKKKEMAKPPTLVPPKTQRITSDQYTPNFSLVSKLTKGQS